MAFEGGSTLEEQGCVVLRSIVSDDLLQSFEAETRALARVHLERRGKPMDDADPMASLLRLGGDFRHVLFPMLKNLTAVRELERAADAHLRKIGFQDWAKMGAPSRFALLKADVPGEQKYLLPMHQDFTTPCHRAWRLWIPLRPANQTNGTVGFVPGTHKLGFLEHDRSNPERPEIPAAAYGNRETQVLEIEAGDALLFHPLLVHCSIAARGDAMKYALIVNYWDLATMADPEDMTDPIPARLRMEKERNTARGDRPMSKV
ncbi:MAG: phytanoyl-CoA dioxygenase family protein [Pseudomonadota bacterium]